MANQPSNLDKPMDFEPYELSEGEEYMSEGQLEHFRNILKAWKADIQQVADDTVHHLQDDTSQHADPADRATQEEEYVLELRARDRERKMLKKIEEAMARIDKDEFGYCVTCGVEIGLRRLEARPTAEQCIDCKSRDEEKERLYG